MDSNIKHDEGNNLDDDKIKQLKKEAQIKSYKLDSIVFNSLNIRKSSIINYSKITNELYKIIDKTKKENSQLNNDVNLKILGNFKKNKKRNQLNNYYNEKTIVIDIFKIPPEKRTFDDLLTIREYLLKTKLYSYFKNEEILEEAIQKLITMCSIEFEYINFNKNDFIYKTGDIPKNFYLIIKGKINVLKQAQKKKIFSGFQYFNYLMDLKKSNEIFLMNLSIKENQQVYPIREKDINLIPYIYIQYTLNLILEDFEVDFKEALQICNLSLESLGLNEEIEITKDYLSKNRKLILSHMPNISNKMYAKYIFLFDDIYKKEIQYFYYQNFDILETGDFFGDFDLEDRNSKRKDTILVKEDTDLAYFNYKLYGRHIFNEKQVIIDREINYLHSNFFFSKIQIKNFIKNYFDYFIMVKYNKNQIIFKENYPLDYIYFIKSGEVQLYSKKSPIQIQELLNDLKKRINNNKLFEEYQYREIKSNIVDLRDDLIIKSLNKIISLKNNEILGIESFYYGYNYLYTAITSQNTYVYKIEKMNLMQILKNESLCYNFLDKKVSDTINIFYNRLFLINNTLITIADKKENFNTKIILEQNYHYSPKENNKVKFKYHHIFDQIKYEKLNQNKNKLPSIQKNKSVIIKDFSNINIKQYKFYESKICLPINSNHSSKHIYEDSLLFQIKKDINKYNEKKKFIKNNILISNRSERKENDNKTKYEKYPTIDIVSYQFTPNKKLETYRNFSSSEEIRNGYLKNKIKKNVLSKSSSLRFDNKQLKKCFDNVTQHKQNESDNLKNTIDSYIPKSIKNQFIHQKYKIDFTKKKLKSYKELKQKLSNQLKIKFEK